MQPILAYLLLYDCARSSATNDVLQLDGLTELIAVCCKTIMVVSNASVRCTSNHYLSLV